jgi:hypothetical protein
MIESMKTKDYGGKKNVNINTQKKLTFIQWFLGLEFMIVFSVFCITMLCLFFVYQFIEDNYHDQYHDILAIGEECYYDILVIGEEYYHNNLSKLRNSDILAIAEKYYHHNLLQIRNIFSQNDIFSQNGIFILTELKSVLRYAQTQFASICYYLLLHFSRILDDISNQLTLMLPQGPTGSVPL